MGNVREKRPLSIVLHRHKTYLSGREYSSFRAIKEWSWRSIALQAFCFEYVIVLLQPSSLSVQEYTRALHYHGKRTTLTVVLALLPTCRIAGWFVWLENSQRFCNWIGYAFVKDTQFCVDNHEIHCKPESYFRSALVNHSQKINSLFFVHSQQTLTFRWKLKVYNTSTLIANRPLV